MTDSNVPSRRTVIEAVGTTLGVSMAGCLAPNSYNSEARNLDDGSGNASRTGGSRYPDRNGGGRTDGPIDEQNGLEDGRDASGQETFDNDLDVQPPTNVRKVREQNGVGPFHVTTAWNRSSDAKRYRVYVNGRPDMTVTEQNFASVVDLSPGTTYELEVAAVKNGTEARSDPVKVQTAPGTREITAELQAPTNLRVESEADGVGPHHATMIWETANRTDTYRVYVDGEARQTVSNQNFASLLELSPDTTYDVQVAAVKDGTETRSQTVSVTTESKKNDGGNSGTIDMQPPTGLHVERSADGISPFHATMVWSQSPDTEAYRVYVNGEVRKTVEGRNFVSLVELSPATTYEVQVAAVKDGTEARSQTVPVTTESKNSDSGSSTSPNIRPPTELRAEQSPDGVGPHHVTMVWNQSPDTDTYQLYVNGEARKTVRGQNFASLLQLTPETTYQVQVAAVKNGTEARSQPVSVTTESKNSDSSSQNDRLQPPTELHAERNPDGVGPFHATMVWTRSPDTDTYRVYVDGEPRQTVTGQNFVSLTELTPETTYEVQVAAVKNGTEARSQTVPVTTEARNTGSNGGNGTSYS